jgi:hypothetical protein
MLKKTLASAIAGVAFIAFLTSCEPPVGPSASPSASPSAAPRLSATVVDELIEKLTTAQTSNQVKRSIHARTLSTDNVNTIKQAALDKIASDGLTDSTALDKILPSMVTGVQSGISGIGVSTDNAAVIVNVANKSALGSLTAAGRSSSLSAGASVESAVGAIGSSTVRAIVAVIPDAGAASAAISGVISSTASTLDSAGISATQLSSAVSSFVASSAAVAASQSNAADYVRAVTESATAAISSMSNLDSTAKAEAVKQTVSATVTAVATQSTNPELIKEIAAAAATSAAAAGVTLDVATVVSTATAGTSVAISATAVAAIASEGNPSISAAGATPATVSAKNMVVYLSVTAVPADGYTELTYKWVQTAGTTVALRNAETAQASFNVPANGDYKFKVTVQNKNGYKTAKKEDVSVSASWAETTFEAAFSEAMTALKARQFDTAYQKFAMATAIDSTNTTAQFWKTFMDAMAISTDPATVSVMKDRIGLVDYPASMDKLFSTQWLNGNFYGTKSVMVQDSSTFNYDYVRGTFTPDTNGQQFNYCTLVSSGSAYDPYTYLASITGTGYFVPDASGADYARYFYVKDADGTYLSKSYSDSAYANLLYREQYGVLDLASPALLPRVDMPAWASFMLDTTGGEDATHMKSYRIFMALLANIITRNPAGLNDMVDQLLAGVFGSRFDAVVAAVDALPDNVSVEIPNDLISAYTPNYTLPTGFTVSIGKAEMEWELGLLKFYKTLLQLLASYDLDYPLTNFQFDWSTTASGDSAKWDNFFATAPKPLSTNVFGDRGQTRRNAAKATMLDSLATLDKAAGLALQRDWAAYIKGVSGYEATADEISTWKGYVTNGRKIAATLKSAIDANTSLFIDTAAISNGGIIKTADYAWPTTATGESVYEVKPGALFTTDILNPRKVFESGSTGFTIYKSDLTGTGVEVTETGTSSGGGTWTSTSTKWTINYATPTVLGSTKPDNSVAYALLLKVNLDRVKEIFPSVAKVIPTDAPTDASGAVYFPWTRYYDYDYTNKVIKPASYVMSDGTWKAINWLR